MLLISNSSSVMLLMLQYERDIFIFNDFYCRNANWSLKLTDSYVWAADVEKFVVRAPFA